MNNFTYIQSTLDTLFEGIESVASHLDIHIFTNGLRYQYQKILDIIREQNREIEQLKAELAMANKVFMTLNTDVLHMRNTISEVLQQPQMKKIEELM